MKKFMSLFASVAAALIVIVIGNVVIVAYRGNEQPDMTIDGKVDAEAIANAL